MQQSKLIIGRDYALSTNPRKGVPESELCRILAFRVRVTAKGLPRWAPNVGVQKSDGIQAARVFEKSGREGAILLEVDGAPSTYKARDFLMPWNQYIQERCQWDKELADLADDKEARILAKKARMDKVIESLERYGSGPFVDSGYERATDEGIRVSHINDRVIFSLGAIEALMDNMAMHVYEVLSSSS